MRKKFRNLLIMMAVFVIVCPIMTLNANATETVNVVANITDADNIVNYTSWETAIEAAKSGDTLKALADIELDGVSIDVTKSLNIDLNKHTVSGIYVSASDISLQISNGSFHTIGEKEKMQGATIEISNCDLYFVELSNQAGLKMTDCWTRMGIDATVKNVDDAKNDFINCQLDNGIDIRNGEAAKVYVSGENSKVSSINIYRTPNAYVQIDGGTVSSIINCGDTYVNDAIVCGGILPMDEGMVYLNGGKYTTEAKIRISSVKGEKIVMPEGKRLVLRGECYILDTPIDSDNVVTDGTNKYLSWAEALSNSADGATLTALCNCNEVITIPVDKEISLDFGQFEYTRGLNIEKNAVLTVQGGTYWAGTFSSSAESWKNEGTLNIVDGKFNAKVYSVTSFQGWGFHIENYGTVNIQGGIFTGLGGVTSRINGTDWGNTYITGGTFVKDGLGHSSFNNGNSNETNQHTFISKGTYCNEMKDLVTKNMLAGADAQIVDLENGSFQIMTAAEAKAYADAKEKNNQGSTVTSDTTNTNVTTNPDATTTPDGTTHPDSVSKPEEPAAEIGEQIVPDKKDNSGAKYVVAAVNKDAATVKVIDGKSAKGKVIVPDKIMDADGNSFKVTEVSAGAYKNNKAISSVKVGSNVEKVGENAFKGASKLTKVDLCKSQVKTIGKNAFSGAKKLDDIRLNGDTIKTIGKNAFKDVKKNCTIVISAKNKTTYKKVVKKIKDSGAKNVKYKYKKH